MTRRILWNVTVVATVVACTGMMVGCSADEIINSSVVSWEIIDGCDDQMGLQVRFFDDESGAVWPSDSTVWVVGENDSEVFVVDCSRDHVICFGATTDPGTSASWGVGIQGTEDCVGCCADCGDGTFPDNTLSCP